MDKNDEIRIQIEELSEEVKKLSEKQNSQYTDTILQLRKIEESISSLIKGVTDERDDEDLYDDAVEAVVTAQKASASYLQRRLKIGYEQATRLMDMLEEEGVISSADELLKTYMTRS